MPPPLYTPHMLQKTTQNNVFESQMYVTDSLMFEISFKHTYVHSYGVTSKH